MSAFTRIDHVQLAMPPGEERRARDFYAGLLGMEELTKPAELAERGGAWFRSGAVVIHLGIEHGFRPATKAHPALVCADYRALVAKLEANGCETIADPTLIDGRQRCYVHDAFGNRIELIDGG